MMNIHDTFNVYITPIWFYCYRINRKENDAKIKILPKYKMIIDWLKLNVSIDISVRKRLSMISYFNQLNDTKKSGR